MSMIETDDGVRLHVEEQGSGTPILFIHEFAGDHRSWEPQVAAFRERYRCIVYAARGYPPSDVPSDPGAYSQARAVSDAITVLDGLGIDQAHIVGLSMGGFCTLHLGLRHPARALSLVVAGCGYGAPPAARDGFRRECAAIADAIREEGMERFAARYLQGPARVQFQRKNPAGWERYVRQFAEHSEEGSALTMLGVQRERPSLFDLLDELSAMTVPTLILAGDEDDGCLDTDLALKRSMPAASLTLLPRTGHTANLEEPEVFNAAVARFIASVEDGTWQSRDRRSITASITGM